MQALFRIGRGIPPPVPDTISRDARDFILQCLQVNPNARPTAAELLDHPFVKRPLPPSSGSASPYNHVWLPTRRSVGWFQVWQKWACRGIPPPVPDTISRDARDFILQCLQVNPNARPTAAELLDHPFVKRPLPPSSGSASPYNHGRRI
ncbi:unnamed protein product [Ilex paraguariensis]|uniref:Protein kinase domain-containing protein n=1 Tax=Ilex paraguariensis TaxID=185542 RepID=A0ABC8TRD9_9AQUA